MRSGEEGSRFSVAFIGSKAWAGRLGPDDLQATDAAGATLAEALRAAGCDPAGVPGARRTDVAAFLEIHIEQGRVLESQEAPVGIVGAIIGMHQVKVRVRSRADHAGRPTRRTAPGRYRCC